MGIKILQNKNLSYLLESYLLHKERLLWLIGGFFSTIAFYDTIPLFIAYSAFLLNLTTRELALGLMGSLLAFILLPLSNSAMLSGLVILGMFKLFLHFAKLQSRLKQSLVLGLLCFIAELIRYIWLQDGYSRSIPTAIIALSSYYCLLICSEKITNWRKSASFLPQNELIYPTWLVLALIICTGRATVGLINITHVIFALCILATAYYGTLSLAVIGGLLLGLIGTITGANPPAWIGYFGICALVGATWTSYGKLSIWAMYTLSSVLLGWLVTDWSGLMAICSEALLAGGIFFLLPSGQHAPLSGYHASPANSDYTKLAQALSALTHYKPMTSLEPPSDTLDCCTQVYLRICHNCSQKSTCWQKDATFTQKYITQAYHAGITYGTQNMLLPAEFTSVCPQSEALNAAITTQIMLDAQSSNHQLSIAQLQHLYSKELNLISKALRQMSYQSPTNLAEHSLRQFLQNENIPVQYAHLLFSGDNLQLEIALKECIPDCEKKLSELLKAFFCQTYVLLRRECNWQADNYCRMFFTPAERYFLAVHAAQRLAPGEKLCGDLWRYFKIDSHTECVFLLDGMGVGESAYRQSSYAAQLLQEMLKSSMAIDDALHLINNHLLLSNPNDSFITLDLLIIDTITLSAELYKAASGNTYLLRDKTIQKISAQSPPLGILANWQPAKQLIHLKANDRLLLLSDGLAESPLNWQEILSDLPISTTEAVRQIINENTETADDQSAVLIDIWSIKQNGS